MALFGISLMASSPSYAQDDYDFWSEIGISTDSLSDFSDFSDLDSSLTDSFNSWDGDLSSLVSDDLFNVASGFSDSIEQLGTYEGMSFESLSSSIKGFTGTLETYKGDISAAKNILSGISSGNIGQLAGTLAGSATNTDAQKILSALSGSNLKINTATGQIGGSLNLTNLMSATGLSSNALTEFLGKSNLTINAKTGEVSGKFDAMGLINASGLSSAVQQVLGATGSVSCNTSTGNCQFKNLFGGLLSGSLGGGKNAISVNLGALLGGTAGLSGNYSGGAIASVLCNVVDWFTGSIGTGIATLAIMVLGLGALMGKFSPPAAIITCVGISIIFGAPDVVEMITGEAGCYSASGITIKF